MVAKSWTKAVGELVGWTPAPMNNQEELEKWLEQ